MKKLLLPLLFILLISSVNAAPTYRGYWEFSSDWLDTWGIQDGTVGGTPTFNTSVPIYAVSGTGSNRSASYNGSTDYHDTGWVAGIGDSNNAVSFWVYIDSDTWGTFETLFGVEEHTSGSGYSIWQMWGTSTGDNLKHMCKETASPYTGTDYNDKAWNHIVSLCGDGTTPSNGTQSELWINGVNVFSLTWITISVVIMIIMFIVLLIPIAAPLTVPEFNDENDD